ncbi:MAG: TIGR02301 family protein, partial [Roseibium sp.]
MSFLFEKPLGKVVAVPLFAVLMFGTPLGAKAQSADNAPPYEANLMRLSEVLGALHFLRPLCGHDDQPSWREQMETFLTSETRDGNRQRRFIERFNQGYRGFSSAYRNCTASARIAM